MTVSAPDSNKVQNRWAVLMMFMVAHGVNDGFAWLIPPLLPAVREHFLLSYTEVGALYTFFNFFGNVLQAPAAYLVHFVPIPAVLVGGLVWLSLGMLLTSFSSSYGFLLWMSAASGAGKATYHPLALTLLSRIFGKESLGRALALHLSGSGIGHVIVPFLVGILVTSFGWRLPIQLWSLLGVTVGVGLFCFLRKHGDNFQIPGKKLRLPFFSRNMALFLLAICIWGIAQHGLMTFLPLFLVDHRGFNVGSAAAVYGFMALSGTLLRPLLGMLMDRMGRRKPVVIGGYVIAGLSILGLSISENTALMYLFILLLGVFASGHAGLSDILMIEMIPSSRREETLGFILSLRMGAAAFSPLIVGLFAERLGMITVLAILSVFPVVTSLLLLFTEEK